MRDVVILFVHLIVVSYPARLCLLAQPGVISSFAEFPSETLGTAKTVEQKFRQPNNEDQNEEKDKESDLPDLPIKGHVKIAKWAAEFAVGLYR